MGSARCRSTHTSDITCSSFLAVHRTETLAKQAVEYVLNSLRSYPSSTTAHKQTNDVQIVQEHDNNTSSKPCKQHIQSSKMIQCSKSEVLKNVPASVLSFLSEQLQTHYELIFQLKRQSAAAPLFSLSTK